MSKSVDMTIEELAMHNAAMVSLKATMDSIIEIMKHVRVTTDQLEESQKIQQAVSQEKEKADKKVEEASDETIEQFEKQLKDRDATVMKLEKTNKWLLGILIFLGACIILTLATMTGITIIYPELNIIP